MDDGAGHGSHGHVDGVFVLSMWASGATLTDALLRRFSAIDHAGQPSRPNYRKLADLNERLFIALGASWDNPPMLAQSELVKRLRPFAEEAVSLFEEEFGFAAHARGDVPWLWSDPRNCFLLPFWTEVLGVKAAVVLAYRNPGAVEASLARSRQCPTETVRSMWDKYTRAALVQCENHPSLVISYETMKSDPQASLERLGRFLSAIGLSSNTSGLDGHHLVQPGRSPGLRDADMDLPNHLRVLHSFLSMLERSADCDDDADVVEAVTELGRLYDSFYYAHDLGEHPYERGVQEWLEFFGNVADQIVETIKPKRVLDAGCAIGLLVEALRERDVEAWGIDISDYAIGQVPQSIAPYCSVQSITSEIDGWFDLITCIEVLEHLPAHLGAQAIANICRHSDLVLFSSSPDDFAEPTHLNVQPLEHWAAQFARHGFYRDFDYDGDYLAPQAVLFRRRLIDLEDAIGGYERSQWRLQAKRRDEGRAARQARAQAGEENHRLAVSLKELQDELSSLQIRRSAEAEVQAREHADLAALLNRTEGELAQARLVYETKLFRYSAGMRRLYGRMRRLGGAAERTESVRERPVPHERSYATWIDRYDTLDARARAILEQKCAALGRQPLISVILPIFNTSEKHLRAAIESVEGQLYTNWELCIADDCSSDPNTRAVLAEYEARDDRIKVVRRTENGHISAASNSALSLATGEWAALLDHDDELAEHALALVALAVAQNPDARVLYSDEDKLDAGGRRHSPYFKPDFDPLLLLGQNCLSHLSVLRLDLVREVGGFREGFEGSQDWDLVLRVTERLEPQNVVHIPHVLYHWRVHAGSTAASLASKPYAALAGQRAVAEHLVRTGRQGTAMCLPHTSFNRVQWTLPETVPLVSIVVPTRDGTHLSRCIDSILRFTTYPHLEIIVVDNGSERYQTLEWLRAHEGTIRVIRDDRPFNYSALNNEAVKATTGELVCLLHDDTEVLHGDWLEEMVSQVLQPGVGVVGAKLLYPNGTVQHAGLLLGVYGVAGHAHRFGDRLSAGYFGRSSLAQGFSAVTNACLLVRRTVWDQLQGLEEGHLGRAFNDVDFCLRVREAGWRVVWTPFAELIHHESTRESPDFERTRAVRFAFEARFMKKRWAQVLQRDPAYNPNLSLVAEDFSLAWPPRVEIVAHE